jgi:hypothetical protein
MVKIQQLRPVKNVIEIELNPTEDVLNAPFDHLEVSSYK